MLTPAERGCLALADISGYTSYLVDTELQHAHDVLADLTDIIVRSLAPPLVFAKLEGDAAFVYRIGDRIDPSMLLDAVAGCYAAFRNRLASIVRATTCQCNACVLIPRLDLKLVAHHGSFARRRMLESEELTGADVVVAHRLLKNHVVEETGISAYGFYTDACIRAMGVDATVLGMRAHRETFEGVGEIAGWVEDLESRWKADQERHRRRVDPASPGVLAVEVAVHAPQAVVWEYLTVPELRAKWQEGVLRVDQQNPSGGMRGVGTTNHCVHGRDASLEEIVDWRPFDYFSLISRIEIPLVPPLLVTWELEPDGHGGTRLRHLTAPPAGIRRLLWPLYAREARKALTPSLLGLDGVIAADAGASAA
jgi:uncharacterized protein YndB with AHSA1/START domain